MRMKLTTKMMEFQMNEWSEIIKKKKIVQTMRVNILR